MVAASAAGSGVSPVLDGATSLTFRMIRLGSEIGRHIVRFDRQNDTMTVRVAVDATVTVLSLPVVRYAHRVEEVWTGGVLQRLDGATDKNGRAGWVAARREADGLVVTGSQTQRYVAPVSAIATSYWNHHMIDGPMISAEDGVLLRPAVTFTGVDLVRTAAGTATVAKHYSIRGAFSVDVWYDTANVWAGLMLTAADGSTVRYERM